jgi:ADP-dependent NAD(P)H-hydrate dehydratase
VTPLTDEVLRRWPLPSTDGGDKEERGRVLLVAGSREIAGAAVLAGEAALRAGAGKLTVATEESVRPIVAAAIPEARVISLEQAAEVAERADSVLIGPGMADAADLVRSLLPRLGKTPLILDACAMDVVRGKGMRFESPVLLTPHAGEMARLTALDKEQVGARQADMAVEWSRRWNAIVALKGAITFVASPGGDVWRNEGGSIGLAISGSGDTLAGIVAGLAARGATLEQATVWGVRLHARAGERLAKRIGPLGFLAREIPAEIPGLMREMC